jgi:hypothetical protein
LTARGLAEEGKLVLVGAFRAEHPQHPVQLVFFVSTFGNRTPQSG